MKIQEKKKKSNIKTTFTTGDIALNIKHFNKMMGTDFNNPSTEEAKARQAAEKAANDTGVALAAAPDGDMTTSGCIGDTSGDTGVAVSEELITEAKRYVKRYYIRPQHIFCSNKSEILKALIDIGDQNCSVYSLKRLTDNDDIHELDNRDIIYYYDDGILYDKNKVRVMDYDLSVKHEEERKKFSGDIDAVPDAAFAKEYEDRLTDATKFEEDLINEASNLSNEEKVRLWHEGKRRENYKAAGIQKLGDFLQIAERDNYTDIAKILTDEIKARGYTIIKDNFGRIILNAANTQNNSTVTQQIQKNSDDKNKEICTTIRLVLEEAANYGCNYLFSAICDQKSIVAGFVEWLKNILRVFVINTRYSDAEVREAILSEHSDLLITTAQKAYDIYSMIYKNRYKNKTNASGITGGSSMNENKVKNELALDFPDINAYGEMLHEGKEINGICCICGEEIEGYGNNAEPVKEGRCCDLCNMKFVIPARMDQMNKNKEDK